MGDSCPGLDFGSLGISSPARILVPTACLSPFQACLVTTWSAQFLAVALGWEPGRQVPRVPRVHRLRARELVDRGLWD